MIEAKSKRLGYAPASSVLQVLALQKDRDIASPLDVEKLRALNIPESVVFPLNRTLHDLALLHEDGRPTELFDRLARAYGADKTEYQNIVKELLKNIYGEVFTRIENLGLNLKEVTAVEIEKAFSDYEPQKQSRRMVYLFMGLCREAGLISDVEKWPHRSNGKFVSRTQQVTTQLSKVEVGSLSEELRQMSDYPQVRANGQLQTHLSNSLILAQLDVLQRLQQMPNDSGWTAKQEGWWRETVKMSANLLLKLLEEGE